MECKVFNPLFHGIIYKGVGFFGGEMEEEVLVGDAYPGEMLRLIEIRKG